MSRHRFLLWILFLLSLLTQAAHVEAARDERILFFHSHITVHQDASLTVAETITVRAEGRQIKRGIYRDFPTTYTTRLGTTARVGFEVVAVERDGRPEPFHIESRSNGKRVYIGSRNVLLDPGEYTYVLRYRTDRQIGFFQEYDELYWNVTGNDWAFPIDHAEAVVELPPGGKVLETAAYTGYQGAKGKDYQVATMGRDVVRFVATRKLAPREGFTVAVSWPKGVVPEPSVKAKAGQFVSDNRSAVVGLMGLALLLSYYILAWTMVGRDPDKGTIIPLFTPPHGFSPAAMRNLMRMGFDDKSFAAAVVDMAVKGYLRIEEDDGEFTLRRTGADKTLLSKGEIRVADTLFDSRQSITLKQKHHKKIKKGVDALEDCLAKDLEKIYFRTNVRWMVPGVLLTILVMAGIVLSSPQLSTALFMSVWLTIWTIGCTALVWRALAQWKAALTGRGLKIMEKGGALFTTLFALPFLAGEVFGLTMFVKAASPVAALFLLLAVGLNVLFYHLLKAPTLSGRSVMDQIEGFRLYLSVAEKERLGILHPPEKTPELFEAYLPYALALDVEHEWSEQFADLLAASAREGAGYAPAWYHGRSFSSFGAGDLAGSLGSSLAGAISSSSSAPGSSSGSGGGGSPGGGGGGGGGGGW